MKKIIQMLLIACMVVLGTQVAFANADKVTVQEGADLTAIHRLAIGSPLYMQVDPKSPNKDMLTQIVYESSRVARCYVISYDTVAQNIKADQNIDIKALDRRTAAKDFKQYVANYADAYVILTVANDSRTTFFFDVYKAGSTRTRSRPTAAKATRLPLTRTWQSSSTSISSAPLSSSRRKTAKRNDA